MDNHSPRMFVLDCLLDVHIKLHATLYRIYAGFVYVFALFASLRSMDEGRRLGTLLKPNYDKSKMLEGGIVYLGNVLGADAPFKIHLIKSNLQKNNTKLTRSKTSSPKS